MDESQDKTRALGIPTNQHERLQARVNQLEAETQDLRDMLSEALDLANSARRVFDEYFLEGLYWDSDLKALYIETPRTYKPFLCIYVNPEDENYDEFFHVDWIHNIHNPQTLWKRENPKKG